MPAEGVEGIHVCGLAVTLAGGAPTAILLVSRVNGAPSPPDAFTVMVDTGQDCDDPAAGGL